MNMDIKAIVAYLLVGFALVAVLLPPMVDALNDTTKEAKSVQNLREWFPAQLPGFREIDRDKIVIAQYGDGHSLGRPTWIAEAPYLAKEGESGCVMALILLKAYAKELTQPERYYAPPREARYIAWEEAGGDRYLSKDDPVVTDFGLFKEPSLIGSRAPWWPSPLPWSALSVRVLSQMKGHHQIRLFLYAKGDYAYGDECAEEGKEIFGIIQSQWPY
jgi:hypothetical protein